MGDTTNTALGAYFKFMLRQVSVAQRLVSAKPGLNFNPFLFSVFFFSKAFSPITFSVLFRAFNYQIVDERIEWNLLFELLYLSSNFALPAQGVISNTPSTCLSIKVIFVSQNVFSI